MRSRIVICAVSALVLGGCGRKAVVISDGAGAAAASRWNGLLTTPAEMAGVTQVRGNAWMGAEGNETHVAISIQNATPGGEHPWHVHLGRCGSNGAIFGSASRYPALKVDGDGKASREAKLDASLPSSGDYYVNVHASTANMQTIVACANLAPPTR